MNVLAYRVVVITYARKERVHAIIGAVDDQPSEHNRPLGMDCRVGDPVLLSNH